MLADAYRALRFILAEPSNRGQRGRRLACGVFWQIWKRLTKIPLVVRMDNGARYIAYPSVVACSSPIYAKVYESRNIRFLRTFLKNGGTMIDIGANIGLYTLSLKDNVSRSIMFEPIIDTVKLLRENMALNGGLEAEIHAVALGEESGEVSFSYKGHASPVAKMAADAEGGVRTPLKTLDEFLDDGALDEIEFVKIDVEGHELGVLKGGRKLFSSKSLRLIQFERLNRTPLAPLLDFFSEYGWEVFALGEGGATVFESAAVQEAHDLFAVPPDTAKSLKK